MNHELPSVAGQMEMTHEDFQRACLELISHNQTLGDFRDSTLIGVLCESVRCSRELEARTKALEELETAADYFEKVMRPYSIHYGSSYAEVLTFKITNARKALGK